MSIHVVHNIQCLFIHCSSENHSIQFLYDGTWEDTHTGTHRKSESSAAPVKCNTPRWPVYLRVSLTLLFTCKRLTCTLRAYNTTCIQCIRRLTTHLVMGGLVLYGCLYSAVNCRNDVEVDLVTSLRSWLLVYPIANTLLPKRSTLTSVIGIISHGIAS